MKLEIFSSISRQRVGMLNMYNFVQYVDEFTAAGSFSIIMPTDEDSLDILQFGSYILFEDDVAGIVKGQRKAYDSDVEIEIYGVLLNGLLSTRVFELTKKYSGTPVEISRKMVSELMISSDNEYRNIPWLRLSTIPEYVPEVEQKVTIQHTGDKLIEALQQALIPYDLGFEVFPVISNYDEIEHRYNLEAAEFRILKPTDRTIDNKFGNIPVVFSQELDNMSSVEYEEDGRDYANVAYVASEGTGTARKLIEVYREGEDKKRADARIECYVDARDLQTETGSGGEVPDPGPGGDTNVPPGTVIGGAFEVAKWGVVQYRRWKELDYLRWVCEFEESLVNSTNFPLLFAINIPHEYETRMEIKLSAYTHISVVLNNEEIYLKNDNQIDFENTLILPLKVGINNLILNAWVKNAPFDVKKYAEVILYDFAADINTDGYLTTTADIWRPSVNDAGDISFEKSAELVPPPTKNIKGPKGEPGTAPHIDPESGMWYIGEINTGVRADGIDGITPHIDKNTGHWFLGQEDTGVNAQGPEGAPSTIPGPAGFSPDIQENAENTPDVYKLDIITKDGTIVTPNLKGKDGEITREQAPFNFGIDNSGDYGYYKNDNNNVPTDEFVKFGTGSGGGSGIFGFEIREDGHLWMVTDDPVMADKFYINDNGHLMCRLGV